MAEACCYCQQSLSTDYRGNIHKACFEKNYELRSHTKTQKVALVSMVFLAGVAVTLMVSNYWGDWSGRARIITGFVGVLASVTGVALTELCCNRSVENRR